MPHSKNYKESMGWDCFDDDGRKIAWFLHFHDAVMWLAQREQAGDREHDEA